jgi:hypothetical protein
VRTYKRDGDAIEGEIPRLAPDPDLPRASPEVLRAAATAAALAIGAKVIK